MDRIVLFGMGERAWTVGRALGAAGHKLVGHISQWQDINTPAFIADIRRLDPNLFLVAGYPLILRRDLLAVPKHGSWNCHGGPVPEYRGGSPLNWQIIDGRTEIGISLLSMDEGLDTGPVIATQTFPFGPNDTIADAHMRANGLFANMVLTALHNFPPPMTPQPVSTAYRRQRTDMDGMIDWTWDGKRIHDFVRALSKPYPGAWFVAEDGSKVRIWSTSLENAPPSPASAPGAASPALATAK